MRGAKGSISANRGKESNNLLEEQVVQQANFDQLPKLIGLLTACQPGQRHNMRAIQRRISDWLGIFGLTKMVIPSARRSAADNAGMPSLGFVPILIAPFVVNLTFSNIGYIHANRPIRCQSRDSSRRDAGDYAQGNIPFLVCI